MANVGAAFKVWSRTQRAGCAHTLRLKGMWIAKECDP